MIKARKAFFSERWETKKADKHTKVGTSWGPSGVRDHVQTYELTVQALENQITLEREEQSYAKTYQKPSQQILSPSWTASRAPQGSRESSSTIADSEAA